ncbi:unnamed protein product [Acanthoscelides obtectus]|uniref:Uncharacterized protein n=1 Tax=Acanthoscelides obtectus TaxID=200917 RepID=A0A9P0Q298_ACAOB|nr:unnamed protein product [Acanthoscelides obtectus]CAK1680582.1 hypothetical protein AOBTE_LOCUS32778 [Acanthoscelides obtectus]
MSSRIALIFFYWSWHFFCWRFSARFIAILLTSSGRQILYLTTGDSHQSIAFCFRLGWSTVSKIVKDV